MIALYIILGALLLISLILLLRVRVVINYEEILYVYLRVLCFKYRLYPLKPIKAKRKKKKQKEAPIKESKPEATDKKEDSIPKKLWVMREILLNTISRFLNKLHFKLIKLNVVVGCDNATATALAYGAVTQGISYLLETLDTISNVDISKRSQISVRSDFISQKSSFEGKIVLYISVAHILYVGWHFLKKYIKNKTED